MDILKCQDDIQDKWQLLASLNNSKVHFKKCKSLTLDVLQVLSSILKCQYIQENRQFLAS